jgi:hypothetical protein
VTFLVNCQQTAAGEVHWFASGPTCVCGKRAATFATGGDQERPTLRLIKGEKKD